MKAFYQDDKIIIYHGDCLKILSEIPTEDIAVVTNPPYGTNFDFGKARKGRGRGLNWREGNSSDKNRDWSLMIGNKFKLDPTPFLRFKEVILWGGNNYPGLPPSRGWLVWDKRNGTTPDHHGDGELAWTNFDRPIRIHHQLWRGIVRQGEENLSRGWKLHPAQKPLALMIWCVSLTSSPIIFDPFMGSGTTLRAAKNLGRKSIGIDIEEKYCEIAAKRMAQGGLDFLRSNYFANERTISSQKF